MPGTLVFQTVPDEHLECALAIADDFRGRGFSIVAEKVELGFPYTPTLLCWRQPTRIAVEVVHSINLARVKEWVSFGRSAGRDFRVALCLPRGATLSAEELQQLSDMQIGAYVADATGVDERLAPGDLALSIDLPDLRAQPVKVRQLLGPAYEKFGRGEWREGFEAACQAFEEESRRYLKRHMASGRISVLEKGKPTTVSASKINKMSMGVLKDMFLKIVSPNHADSLIGETLESVNKDRIAVVHRPRQSRTETRLRKNVGRHMWSLMNAMKLVVK